MAYMNRYAVVNEFPPTAEQVDRTALVNEILRLQRELALSTMKPKKVARARKLQFKAEAFRRAHLSTGLSRYVVA
jgi:CBS domain containing-hemolysin-like protein